MSKKRLEDYVTSIPDFPREGVLFRDITTVIEDPEGLRMAVDGLVDMVDPNDVDIVVGSESRGFVFGAPVAYRLGKGFVMARKKGRLPRETVSETYNLEYGIATIEVHKDSIKPGMRAFIVDDLVATGGTTKAVANLVERLGGKVVAIGFVMELAGFDAKGSTLKGLPYKSLIVYPGK